MWSAPRSLQEIDHVLEELDVAALVGGDRDALGVLLDGGVDDLLDRAVVAEVDDLGAVRLQDAAHDVDRRVVAVEQRRRGHETDFVVRLVAVRWGQCGLPRGFTKMIAGRRAAVRRVRPANSEFGIRNSECYPPARQPGLPRRSSERSRDGCPTNGCPTKLQGFLWCRRLACTLADKGTWGGSDVRAGRPHHKAAFQSGGAEGKGGNFGFRISDFGFAIQPTP